MNKLQRKIALYFLSKKLLKLRLEKLQDMTLVDRILGDTTPYIKK